MHPPPFTLNTKTPTGFRSSPSKGRFASPHAPLCCRHPNTPWGYRSLPRQFPGPSGPGPAPPLTTATSSSWPLSASPPCSASIWWSTGSPPGLRPDHLPALTPLLIKIAGWCSQRMDCMAVPTCRKLLTGGPRAQRVNNPKRGHLSLRKTDTNFLYHVFWSEERCSGTTTPR